MANVVRKHAMVHDLTKIEAIYGAELDGRTGSIGYPKKLQLDILPLVHS